MLSNPVLWQRLQALDLDKVDAVFPFSKRLARDNNWSIDYSRALIEEYKKFAYLAFVAGHEVTPSDEVDQVWHLHLTYTRHYWREFNDALGGPLHHEPTKGGGKERKRFGENYDNTLASYAREFGAQPDPAFWPSAKQRFGYAPFMRRIRINEYVMIKKRDLAKAATISGGVLAALSVNAYAFASAASGNKNTMVVFIALAVVFLGAGVAILSSRIKAKRNKKNNGCGAVAAGGGATVPGKATGNNGKDGNSDSDGGGDSGCGGCGGCGG